MPETRTPSRLRQARTCYDHLAGEAAVAIYRYMEQQAWIDAQGSALTEEGERQFQRLGVMLDPQTRRKPCAACLDWSERRFHLGRRAAVDAATEGLDNPHSRQSRSDYHQGGRIGSAAPVPG